MKKDQIPGKRLTKDEQRQVIGGAFTNKKTGCICFIDDSFHESGCKPTCFEAQQDCYNVCEALGGPVEILGFCSDC